MRFHRFDHPLRHFTTFLVVGVLALALVVGLAWCSGGSRIVMGHKDLLTVPWPDTLSFAGESVPLDDFYVRESWERDFLVTLSEDFQNILYLKRTHKYFPFIEDELKRRGLPDDLKYIAVAESGLRDDVASHAGAAGLWQFIPETGRRYGLVATDTIDERGNFEKSTIAALDYLTKLHADFGSWTLAAAAYNMGENGLARQIAAQKQNGYYDLYLNDETSRYLFRILAAKYVMADPSAYGYDLAEKDYFAWPAYRVVTAGAVADLAAWANENGTTLRSIKELNPWIVGTKLPAGNWPVKVEKK